MALRRLAVVVVVGAGVVVSGVVVAGVVVAGVVVAGVVVVAGGVVVVVADGLERPDFSMLLLPNLPSAVRPFDFCQAAIA